jgi:hypothetical protein
MVGAATPGARRACEPVERASLANPALGTVVSNGRDVAHPISDRALCREFRFPTLKRVATPSAPQARRAPRLRLS